MEEKIDEGVLFGAGKKSEVGRGGVHNGKY